MNPGGTELHPSRYRKGRTMTVQTPHNEYPVDYAVSPPWAQETETMPWTDGHRAEAPAWPNESRTAAYRTAGHQTPGGPAAGHRAPVAENGEAATEELGSLPFGGTIPPYGSPANRHGQLLVRFPQAVLGESRPDAPSWRPVVAWTFFLSVLGVVSAMRRSGKAKAYGRPRAPYWIAFLATLVAGGAFWSFLIADVVVPMHRSSVESAATTAVQAKVLGDGRIEEAVGTKVKSGGCAPAGVRGDDGLRPYTCTFRLADGRSASVQIKADARGNWETAK
ncbi:hypothetical protein [Actinoplanes sp. NPDC020271]|uniref:hypothetical protein n=1 Tax=Actinoplanes sp. NPDC020271 TaxID=3363896 RepID=UPI003788633B